MLQCLCIIVSGIPWDAVPSMPEEVKEVISKLIVFDPAERASLEQLKELKFLEGTDWENIHETTPLFVPVIESETDTFYFAGG